jgi:outer membrane protein TolC
VVGTELGLGALTLASLGSGASIAAALAAGVSAPLFDGGAGVARLGAEQAALDQAQAAYRAAVLAALKEVEDALFALRGDAERLLHLREAAESAANAALLARQRYASGLIDFQTVLDTQRGQLSTQDAVAAAEAELGADHVRLYRSLGGGWLGEPPAASAGRAATRTAPP